MTMELEDEDVRGLLTLVRRAQASLVGCRKAAGGAASIEPGTRKKQNGEAAGFHLAVQTVWVSCSVFCLGVFVCVRSGETVCVEPVE